ncbi:MAG: hypothetical protein R3F11_03370 [Verrucomicrobiales bacterium]
MAEALAELGRSARLDSRDRGDDRRPRAAFPRAKSNALRHRARCRSPSAGAARSSGTVVGDFASLTDLAPTFLAAAGVDGWAEITGVNLLPALREGQSHARPCPGRQERHVPGQENQDPSGYPCRALRNAEFLYIRNYRPELW